LDFNYSIVDLVGSIGRALMALLEYIESRLTMNASLGQIFIPMLEHVSGHIVSTRCAYWVDGLKCTNTTAFRVFNVSLIHLIGESGYFSTKFSEDVFNLYVS